MAIRYNDPSFNIARPEFSVGKKEKPPVGNQKQYSQTNSRFVNAKKTTVENKTSKTVKCPLHEDAKHNLAECRLFLGKSIEDKREIIKKHGLCFKCVSGKHLAKDCLENIKCLKCQNSTHNTIFHIERKTPEKVDGGEQRRVEVSCTEICGSKTNENKFKGESCAKTLLVNVYPVGKPNLKIKTYATIDDQSNQSLARSEFFNLFSRNFEHIKYTLRSCSGESTCSGRKATGYVLESLDGTVKLNCPPIIECNQIPCSKQEIATPAVARQYTHLKDLEHVIPEIDPNSEVLLLIGRDMLSAHHVMDQRLGTDNEPYAQKLRLGWTIIGESCLGLVHTPETINVFKTSILPNGREAHLDPCEYGFNIKHKDEVLAASNLFQRTSEDDTPGLSQEDREFLSTMNNQFDKTVDGKLSAPLPFRQNRPTLPNNYLQAKHRAENLERSLKRDKLKQQHFMDFMNKIFLNNHAELAPPLRKGQEVWYLPIFGVYNAKKPSKIRVVFDSSASYEGICLNDVLLKGPDLTNNLVGVLLKFRKGQIAATADIEQMFFNFEVNPEDRDFLRFIWFQDNDNNKPLVEYRMRVHVFGNSPSPSVATYGLRKAVCSHDDGLCDDVCKYVKENFYVDDGLVSADKPDEIVKLIKNTQDRLMHGGRIRLHKLVSNSAEVLNSFEAKDLADGITEMNFDQESSFLQRSLGLIWNVIQDSFTFRITNEDKPFTKRGLLSVINGIFDPIGFATPVILGGRIILRKAIQNNSLQWDDPLPIELLSEWQSWKQSLEDLQNLDIPRSYTSMSLAEQDCELHIFCDASKEAIAAVGYIHMLDDDSQFGFVLGKSKLAPNHGHTIPRLELCAAVLGAELAVFIQKQLNIAQTNTYFYTDSQVVLGYIHNETRRFYVYVSNRIDKILKASSKQQWHYVPTELNPADHGTRPMGANKLEHSIWLKGPKYFIESPSPTLDTSFEIVQPEFDKEVVPLVEVKKSDILFTTLGTHRFERFSSWTMKTEAKDTRSKVDILRESEILVLKEIQSSAFKLELEALHFGKSIPRNSHILDLSPVLDSCGILHLGGRLSKANFDINVKQPIIIPGKTHIATLLVRNFHQYIEHQGRHYTEGAIRANGYWITGGKRLVNSVISSCIKCKRLRGKPGKQKMADLPSDRITWTPPFTNVAVDCFGPWSVVTRRTRGAASQSKRWAVLFSCLVTRAIHIEVIEDMSSSCFINALRRFIALRGPVSEFRSDRGSNFVGAVNELGIHAIQVEDPPVSSFLMTHKIIWRFSSPQSSHMNGAVERMIGLARRVLESILMDNNHKQLTHEVLCTFMAEVCCIVNSRPITTVSCDPSSPTILTPSVLLTQKTNHSDIDTEHIKRFEELSIKDMYKAHWKHVQVLANQFWKRWKNQYLNNLQPRKKWQTQEQNLKEGDCVIMIDDDLPRNQWPLAIVDKIFPSESDGLVRKVSVRVIRDDTPTTYTGRLPNLFTC